MLHVFELKDVKTKPAARNRILEPSKSSDLPILWPTGVEKGFPKRNSMVSPSENIPKNM